MTVQDLKTRPFVFVTVFYAAWMARLMALPFIDPPKNAFLSHLIFGEAGRFIVWCLLPTAWIILIEHRALASALHPVERHSLRLALALTVLLTAVLFLGIRFTRGHWFIIPAGHNPLEYVMFVVGVLLLALGEEFTFRGVLLSGLLRSGTPFWRANAIAAAAFALSHWPGWLMFGGVPAIHLLTATVRVFVFGYVLGGLVRAEGGLIAAISVHTLNDVLVGTLL